MKLECEVVGWLVDADRAQVLVRDEDGRISLKAAEKAADHNGTFAQRAIQTGSFRRGNPIVDPVTRETLSYEMESVSSPMAALA